MINFFSENNFELEQKENYENWLRNVLIPEEKLIPGIIIHILPAKNAALFLCVASLNK